MSVTDETTERVAEALFDIYRDELRYDRRQKWPTIHGDLRNEFREQARAVIEVVLQDGRRPDDANIREE